MCIRDSPTPNDLQTAYKLSLQTALLASQLSQDEISLNFFSESFIILEEHLAGDSKHQYDSLIDMIQTLQFTLAKGCRPSQYEMLTMRCIQNCSRLLKKQDQCRTILLCSHLWFTPEADDFQNGKKVLECIQRSLKLADSVMDSFVSCQLMIEILDKCVYYYVKGKDTEIVNHITTKYVNALIKLVGQNLNSLRAEQQDIEGEEEQEQEEKDAEQEETVNVSSDGLFLKTDTTEMVSRVIPITDYEDHTSGILNATIGSFVRICAYIGNQDPLVSELQQLII